MRRYLDNLSFITVFFLVVFNAIIWYQVFAGKTSGGGVYFLDVGQGDSELMVLPGGVKILIDAGPANGRVARVLGGILPRFDRHVDLGVITHPQADHFGGFADLLDRYDFGAVIFNGRSCGAETGNSPPGVCAEWRALTEKIKERGVPFLTLGAGDAIINGVSRIDVLSPGPEFLQSAELNDTGLVMLARTPDWRSLFTADIGVNVEKYLAESKSNLRADILKVAHHGSRYSSAVEFLAKVNPKVAIAEVGEGNSYGHPAKDTLNRLGEIGAAIFRTDKNGTVRISAAGSLLQVFDSQ